MYSTKVIGFFLDHNQFPEPILFNEDCDTGNNRNFVSTFEGRLVHKGGIILPFSNTNIAIYQRYVMQKDSLNLATIKEIYDFFVNDFKLRYPSIKERFIHNTSIFLNHEGFKKPFKTIFDFIPEIKENKKKKSPEALLKLKNKLLKNFSNFSIIPYNKSFIRSYNDEYNRNMIENGYIHIENFIKEFLVVKGEKEDYYRKMFSGLIYDEAYGKKIIHIDSFLEYANNIDGLLKSVEDALANKKFINLNKYVDKFIKSMSNYAVYEYEMFSLEKVESKEFPIRLNLKIKNSIFKNCKANLSSPHHLKFFNKICDEKGYCGYYEVYSKDEVYFHSNIRKLKYKESFDLEDIFFGHNETTDIIDYLISIQKNFNPLEFVLKELLKKIDYVGLRKGGIYVNDVKITSRKKLEEVIKYFESIEYEPEDEILIKVETCCDTLKILCECAPYYIITDEEDGDMYIGVPKIDKKEFKQNVKDLLNHHLSYILKNDNISLRAI